jgi:alpha-tubulin suppressor-like RCC1 family protein
MNRVRLLNSISTFVVLLLVNPLSGAVRLNAIQVSGGEDHSLALTDSNTVWTFGENGWYQLGDGTGMSRFAPVRVVSGDMPTDTNYIENISQVDAGWTHSLALDANSNVWAWRWNDTGQLGYGRPPGDHSAVPVRVISGAQDPQHANTSLKWISYISAGRSGRHSLALDNTNDVWSWGHNSEGQLGIGSYGEANNKNSPVHVLRGEQDSNTPYLQRIIAVAAGEEHSIALEKLDPAEPNCLGRVYTWGENSFEGYAGKGKLGTGDLTSERKLTPVCVRAGEQDPNHPDESGYYLSNIVAVAAGWDHSMALEKTDPNDPNCLGRVYTWGNNSDTLDSFGGRLGNGTTDDSSLPVLVHAGEQNDANEDAPLINIVSISAGEGHCLALDRDAILWVRKTPSAWANFL